MRYRARPDDLDRKLAQLFGNTSRRPVDRSELMRKSRFDERGWALRAFLASLEPHVLPDEPERFDEIPPPGRSTVDDQYT